ncbi:MAG TPA: PAS domain-containing protein [Burkholderiaceae bacterium]|nr:PAS domain-containing protein [Burkholderiaceae bacterium]
MLPVLNIPASGRAEALYVQRPTDIATAQQDWSTAALASTPDCHYVLGLNGRFCYANRAFSALLQQPAAALIGKNFFDAGYPPELAAALQRQIVEAIRSRHQTRHETQFQSPTGAAVYHEYVFTPLCADDDTVEAVAGAVRDVSQHKNAEKAWQQAREQLENQMRQRTAELTEANQLLQVEIGERRLAEQRLLESQQLLRHLAAYQEGVKEGERKRIAREIHDELGQNLLALRIDVLRLQARTASRHPVLSQRVGSALAQIDRTIKSVRNLINNLRPPVLDLGLHAAIEWQISEFQRLNNIACRLSGDGRDCDGVLDERRELAFFRILQESLTNIARHAQASHVSIELRRDAAALSMKISDDGVGMDIAAARQAGSFGLLGMYERISHLQGELAIDSAPGQGVTLTVSIPLDAGSRTLPASIRLPILSRPAPSA